MKRRLPVLAALAATGALMLAACGSATPGEGGGDTGGENTATSTGDSGDEGGGDGIRIGIKFDQPGLGFKDGDTYTGFDVDVATYIADKLGFSPDQIEWVESVSAQRETMLQNGQVDMIVATYSITPERDEVVDFAGPYFIAGQDLLVRADDDSIQGPEDLNGKNLCSVSGSTSAKRIKDDFADQVQLIEQPGYSECIQFLKGGQVDAVTTDDIILAGLAAADGSGTMKVVGNPFSDENYGVGLPEGSDKCEPITEAITEMIDDGSWEKFIQKNTEGANYTPSDKNPPTPKPCGS
ncbi:MULTISPECIES: glutamate ABC transporter substrate-binding protein [unclassified Pseudactinotalea]|uniref:glutamate ABC transporter substrate-binding protein n=1 Tax=unclassified Pseudactinotalea TaxID=2649176 RepID=UPI00128CB8AB|nr:MULTISPECIES: glutamate ABC transporter substrate-binding protein [unclassified Pseudactinotalea]MPV49878.1 transporter substrate-binding domain-containing protein [Pseudactinotalea sp. HY160]QGH69141.1 transporter substrate-binding domain-containing protein [Pseudactinotalea sp. HY158]